MKYFFAFIISLIIGVIVLVSSAVSARNWAVKQESQLQSLDSERQQKLADYEIKITGMVQVPEMYRDDLIKVVRENIQGRYGKDGSKAMFQAMRESNITFDSSLYKKIQDQIEIARDDYSQVQTRLNDSVAVYRTGLDVFPRNIFLGIFGMPRVNLDNYKPVITDRVDEAIRTHREKPLQLRSKE